MHETAKNYEMRKQNGIFENYLHGKGIDIGGGDDCLVLPKEIEGSVDLWDINDGDAQWMRKIQDETYDFVYSSHCLEHMRNPKTALLNWLRITKTGGYLFICVPHEKYYEKSVWPSMFNSDHKYSFTPFEATDLPRNIVISELLEQFADDIEVVFIKENLENYNFALDFNIDQTRDERTCAQIDFLIKKKRNHSLTDEEKAKLNTEFKKDKKWFKRNVIMPQNSLYKKLASLKHSLSTRKRGGGDQN